MRFPYFLLTLCVIVILTACQKEVSTSSGGGSTNITGNYKFVSLHSVSTSVAGYNLPGDNEKDVTYSDYWTKNNTGIVSISSTTFTSTNLAYDIDTLVNSYLYINGTLSDSSQSAFTFSVPASNGSSPYKIIGTDSIYFSSGIISGGLSGTSGPSGGHFKIQGNQLILTSKVSQNRVQNVQGVNITTSITGNEQIILQKQ